MRREGDRVRRLTATALLAAAALALSFLESLLPPLPVPGAKPGLANVTVMFALTGISFPAAAAITVVKALFALLRGPTAFLMSAAGGTLSLLTMALFHRLFGHKTSFVGLGVIGALAHNTGQWLMAYVLLGDAMLYYAPLLWALAIPAGIVTGIVLNVTFPYWQKIPK